MLREVNGFKVLQNPEDWQFAKSGDKVITPIGKGILKVQLLRIVITT